MHPVRLLVWAAAAAAGAGALAIRAISPSTAGIEALVSRRLPAHADAFEFVIVNATNSSEAVNDSYVVSSTADGKIQIQGNSLSALLSGFHRYLADVVHVDIWWFIGSRLDAAVELPSVPAPLQGTSIVPIRYHFNTVTTSYTSAFWSWEDWELQLDWMALRGINLPLAWIGAEKIFIEVFQEIGLTDAEIESFLSGPAFLAWNHFGNIQGSWRSDLPYSWVDDQFELQKKIVQRMVELGMTPILPAFPGFVPWAITRIFPDIDVVNGSSWQSFGKYTSDTFLDPFDPRFEQLQRSFIAKQKAAYGNVTSYYALDQFNENNPLSGDLDYLKNVSSNTWKTLKSADPDAIWVMQGWLFTSSASFWTDSRIESFLGGITVDSDLLVLDLFSESQPQWQRTNSYYGKPWVWCQLHDYGHNHGLYGQISNLTLNPIQALANSSSLVGFGLSMEGQEGNEVVYDLLLDQAWNPESIDTVSYFHDWVTTRYSAVGDKSLPGGLYQAWELIRPTVYNNTNLTANAVPKAIFELIPSTSGLTGRTGHHPTAIHYDTAVLVHAWNLLYNASVEDPTLLTDPAYQYDLVDWTRQVLANAFIPAYQDLVNAYTATNQSVECRESRLKRRGQKLFDILTTLDAVLATNEHFRLSEWIKAARATAGSDPTIADFLEYEARDQITLWGPTGQISDYASKSWSGLVSTYYLPRWQKFVDYLVATAPASYNQTAFSAQLLQWEILWVNQTTGGSELGGTEDKIEDVVPAVLKQWGSIFGQ